MPSYNARCYNPAQGFADLVRDAESETDLRNRLREEGWQVVSVAAASALTLSRRSRSPRFSVDAFARELLTLLDAGMTLSEAIEVLANQKQARDDAGVLLAISGLIAEGKSFSAALESRPEVFPVLFVASVRSSEASGIVPDALRRYLAYRAQVDRVRNRFIAAATYPLVLIALSGGLIIFLLGFVVPRFSRIYSDMGEAVPLASRIMIRWSAVLESHGLSIGLAVIAALAALAYGFSRPAVRGRILHAVWQLPGVGQRLRLYDLARFTRTLAMLQLGGIPFVPALGMTAELIRQPALRGSVEQARRHIAEGKPVTEVFAQTGLATDVGVRLLGVAERGGDLAAMLARVADLYDQTLERDIEWFSRLVEPLLMLVVGVVIGVVILLMYMPIFELANMAR